MNFQHHEQLDNFLETCSKENRTIGLRKNPDLLNKIMNYTLFMDNSYSMSQRILFCVLDIDKFPICKKCGKIVTKHIPTSFDSALKMKHMLFYCDRKCYNGSEEKLDKLRKHMIEKYGVDSYSKTKEFKEKYENTCTKKYGVSNISQSQEFQKDQHEKFLSKKDTQEYKEKLEISRIKRREKCLQKYGVNHPSELKEVQEKFKITCLQKYGSEHPSQSDIIKNKTKNTCLEKYGVEYVIRSDEVQNKIKEACLKKYGTEYAIQSEEIKKKQQETVLKRYGKECIFLIDGARKVWKDKAIRKYGTPNNTKKYLSTCIKKYGQTNTMCVEEFRKKNSQVQRSSYYDRHINNNDIVLPLFSKEDYVNCDDIKHTKFLWKCKKCGNEFEYIIDGNWNNLGRCPECYPRLGGRSKMEQEIFEFVRSILPEDVEIITNSRNIIPPKELDIYIPSRQLAIEFDGLYWHSVDNGVPWNYHLQKTLACQEKGIKLIHIFEDEWILKQNIIKSVIKSKLGIFDKIVYARKCEVASVPNKVVESFINDNHLQGYKPASINIALFYDDEIVSVMTFGHSRYNKKYQYEMYRFCNLLNTKVTGGASKMYKYFLNRFDPQSIVTYCDRRFSDGKIYKDVLKMNQLLTSEPNYFYIHGKDSIIRESRVKYQKHKLQYMLQNYDPNKTEHQNMSDNDYYRIYDCGNLVFGYIKN